MLKNHSHFLSKFWIKAESTHNGESCVCEVLIYLSKKGEISLLVNCAIEYILAFLLQFCRESFPTAPILWHGIFHKIFHNYIELCTETKHSNKIRNLARWVWHTVLTTVFDPLIVVIYLCLAAPGLCRCVWAFSGCGKWVPLSSCGVWASSGGLSPCRARALGLWGFSSYRLSCPLACGIFPDRGLNSCLLHWQVNS